MTVARPGLWRWLSRLWILVLPALAGCGSPPPDTVTPAAADAPGPCVVSGWGPQEARVGERFNAQPDGYSAFWVRARCTPPRVLFVFAGMALDASVNDHGLTASFNADGVLARPGEYELHLRDPASGAQTHLGRFRVHGEAADNALPPPPPAAWPRVRADPPPPRLIAHAGGGMDGHAYLNSLDALEHNYALGHRVFEVDFSWTADGELVAIHDWDAAWRRGFRGDADGAVPTHAQFMRARMRGGQRQIDVARLDAWLAAHPDARIVTDVRGRNLHALQYLATRLGTRRRQLIPQMYHAHVYADLRALGYEQIIFTLYATRLPPAALLDFIARTPLYAVTINPARDQADHLIEALTSGPVPVYVHTFNEVADLERFRARGVHGVYTDFLHPLPGGGVARQ